jgi:zinc transporter 2
MAGVLHGGSCHSFHHNHSHGSDLLNHQHSRSSGDDETKVLQIDDNDIMTTQSQRKSAENINVQAAFLHVLGDFLQSIGVIIAAVIIKIYVSF